MYIPLNQPSRRRLIQAPSPMCLRRRTDGAFIICCAYDGSDMSIRALEASTLFTHPRDEVVAMFGYSKETDPKDEARCKATSLEVATRKQLPNFKFFAKAASTPQDIPHAIVEFSDRQVAGMICTGTRHTVQGDKRPVGRMTDALVRYSHVPVCVIRPGGSRAEGRYFLVAIDGSQLALKAVEFVLQLARRSDQVAIFTINSDRAEAEEHLKEVHMLLSKNQTQCVAIAAARIPRERSVTVAENICQIVDEREADFIVLSTGLKRKDELGSTSTYCIYHANCNLIIYKNQAFLAK